MRRIGLGRRYAAEVHRIIYDELVVGRVLDASRDRLDAALSTPNPSPVPALEEGAA